MTCYAEPTAPNLKQFDLFIIYFNNIYHYLITSQWLISVSALVNDITRRGIESYNDHEILLKK